jgi:hypothetical protein
LTPRKNGVKDDATMNQAKCLFGAGLLVVAACGGSTPRSEYPPGTPIDLLDGPAHLGNNRAGSQNFTSGMASAARICSLINMPETASVYLQVVNLRNSETLSNQLTVNGKPFVLGITLERDNRTQETPLSTQTSPVFPVTLEAGPSEICLVAGQMAYGEIDDFEIERLVLFVNDIDPEKIAVRKGLSLGEPGPSTPPSRPWGANQ